MVAHICSGGLGHQRFNKIDLKMWSSFCSGTNALTHWGRVTYICVSELTIIGSDNGLSPERRQAIIWTSAGILLIGPLGTNFNEISIAVQIFSFKEMHLTMSSAKWRPLYLGLNVLRRTVRRYAIMQLSGSGATQSKVTPVLRYINTLCRLVDKYCTIRDTKFVKNSLIITSGAMYYINPQDDITQRLWLSLV